MKKIALVLGFLIVTSQLPICPVSLLPSGLSSSLEYGCQWTRMFLRAFTNTPEETASSTAQKPEPVASVESEASAAMIDDQEMEAPDVSVEMAAFASAPTDPSTISFSLPTADLQMEGIPAPPVVVNIPLPADKNVRIKVQKEVECAMQKVRMEMQRELRELHRQQHDAASARSAHQRLQNLQKIRLFLKSA